MTEFTLPRGLRDIPPEETASAESVRVAFVETCKLFDYKLMEPSSLELLETLEARSGPAIRDEIYFFEDKSKRELGLRFDLTVGLTRYVTSKREIAPPVRFGCYGSVWRYDEPQFGRYRWFYQWDIELFGPSNAEADAEVIEFTYSLFKKLGTKPLISIGSRRIVESFVRKSCGINEEDKLLDAFRAVDKLSKKSIEEIASEYSNRISKEQLQKIADFAGQRGNAEQVAKSIETFQIDAGGLLDIVDSLKSRGVKEVELNLRIVRGLDYYTDMVFEAFDSENPKLGSLCGGGRYDSLPPVYGRPDLGATGVAGGVERAILAYNFSKGSNLEVFVAPVGKDPKIIRTAAAIASGLREMGIPAQSEITEKSLRKILESQSAVKTKAVVIVGEKEVASDSVKIRWMDSAEEVSVRRSDLDSALMNRLGKS